MRTVMAACGGTILAASLVQPAFAQQVTESPSAERREVAFDPKGPAPLPGDTSTLSPSSATATVSPSSVPQAVERMDDGEAPVHVSLGGLYAEGKFGTGSKTTIWSSALGVRARTGGWEVSASLPWMRIHSRSTFLTGIDSTPVLVAPNTSARYRVSNGLGDLTLGTSYTIAPSSSPVEIELSGRIKLDTATRRSGLSSGRKDYAVGADISYPLGRLTPFASATYRFLGDTRAYPLRNGVAASAGASYRLGEHGFLLASYHYARAATRFVDNSHELFAGASTSLGATPLRLTGFATKGLSNGAASFSAGIALSVGFGRGRRDA